MRSSASLRIPQIDIVVDLHAERLTSPAAFGAGDAVEGGAGYEDTWR